MWPDRRLSCALQRLVFSPKEYIVNNRHWGRNQLYIMAITTVGLNSQSAWQQFQLQQAQGAVDRAEQNAHSVQTQSRIAQEEVDKAKAKADSLKGEASQAQSTADQATLQLQTTKSLRQVGTQVSSVLTHAVQGRAAVQPAANAQTPKAVVNTQGQTIGTVINTTA